jgi:hypothetical protein
MPDGTSNTIVFAHRLKKCDGNQGADGGTADTVWGWYPRDGDNGLWTAPAFGFFTYCKANGCPTPASPIYTSGLFAPSNLGTGNGMDYDHGRSYPNPSGIPFTVQPASGFCLFEIPASPHAVMVVGLGDGSVRSISPTISVTTWFRACLPNDGNPWEVTGTSKGRAWP